MSHLSLEQPITLLLRKAHQGDTQAFDQLTPHIYQELKRIAYHSFSSENSGHTLQPTALLNEAFEKIVKADVNWQDRQHFFALSARIMRRVLVDHAKAKSTQKRGGNTPHTAIDEQQIGMADTDVQLLALDEAIQTMNQHQPRKATIVELVYFGGLTFEEAAKYLNISKATVSRELKLAEAWLKFRLSE